MSFSDEHIVTLLLADGDTDSFLSSTWASIKHYISRRPADFDNIGDLHSWLPRTKRKHNDTVLERETPGERVSK